jgi:hypothetical protein
MKKLLVIGSIATLLSGCSDGTIIYKGVERPVSEVEEIIADELEVENPELDLELNIYEETED